MLVTRLLCPFVGCAYEHDVKAPHDEPAIEAAQRAVQLHRVTAHRGAKSLVSDRPANRWEYEVRS